MAKKKSTNRWQDITNEKEKYQAYLCSREWSEKREKVRKRSGNRCERCCIFPMDACHHLTYQRKFREDLEDLQAICDHCHKYTHGKAHFDPCASTAWTDYLLDLKAKHETAPVDTMHIIGLRAECNPIALMILRELQLIDEQFAVEEYLLYSADEGLKQMEWLRDKRRNAILTVQQTCLSYDVFVWHDHGRPVVEDSVYHSSIDAIFG